MGIGPTRRSSSRTLKSFYEGNVGYLLEHVEPKFRGRICLCFAVGPKGGGECYLLGAVIEEDGHL